MSNSNSNSNSRKPSKGRQKVQMVKMEKDSNLQVTFSKRRAGLFKKASELCTLCGAEIAMVVFSPGQKVFSFGHPDVETITDRYLSGSNQKSTGTMQLVEAHRNANVRELNIQVTEINSRLEAAKKRGEELKDMMKENQSKHWWCCPTDQLDLTQLQMLKSALEGLKKNVARRTEQLLHFQNSNAQQQLFMGSSSNVVMNPPNNFGFSTNMMPPDQLDDPPYMVVPGYNPKPHDFNLHSQGFGNHGTNGHGFF